MDPRKFQLSRRRLLASAAAAVTAAATPTGGAVAQSALAPSTSPDLWRQASEQWVMNPRLAYFDTARFAPGTRAMLAAEYRASEALHHDPQAFFRDEFNAASVQSLCARLGQWLDCSADELCFSRNATQGLLHFAQQVPLQAGDEVVIHSQLPQPLRKFWEQQARLRGLVLKSVELPLPIANAAQVVAAFENALSERTRVLMCSHVQELDGAILPIRELGALAHKQGALCLVDGSFSLGALQFSLASLGCDVYGSSFGHWLNGPATTGLLYVRRELHARLGEQFNSGSTTLLDTVGWPQLAGRWHAALLETPVQFQMLPLALDFQERMGRARIEARLRALQIYARLRLQALSGLEWLTPNQPGLSLHILSVRSNARSAEQIAEQLRRNDSVIVSGLATQDGGNPSLSNVLRIAFNVYNSHDDIDRLVLGLQRAIRA